MHTKQNLMEELKKIDRVIGKAYPGAPHDRWLIIDATVGQNGLNQAREFHQSLGLTGIIVAKLYFDLWPAVFGHQNDPVPYRGTDR